MYFYKHKGKQCLSLHGDLLLSRNGAMLTASSKSNAPRVVTRATYACDLKGWCIWRRVRATWLAVRFIWGRGK